MKKSLFTVSAIAALSLLLVPGSSIAEPTHPNEVGLYMTSDGLGETGTMEIGYPVVVYLVLTRPTDSETGIPYTTINAFECQLNFNPIGNLFKLSEAYPVDYLNVGDNNNIALG